MQNSYSGGKQYITTKLALHYNYYNYSHPIKTYPFDPTTHLTPPYPSENTPKLTDAPSFCHIASLQVGYGGGNKPSKHSYGFRYDIRHITEVPKS